MFQISVQLTSTQIYHTQPILCIYDKVQKAVILLLVREQTTWLNNICQDFSLLDISHRSL